MKLKLVRVSIFTTTMALLLSVVFNTSSLYAADDKPATSKESATSSADKSKKALQDLSEALASIDKQKKAIARLQSYVKKSKGITQTAFNIRLDKAWMKLLEQGLGFAESVIAEEEAGIKVDQYRKQAIEILKSQAQISNTTEQRISSRIEIPAPDLSAADKAAAYSKVFSHLEVLNQVYAFMIKNLKLSNQFGIDISRQEALLKEKLEDRAANGSIFLELATNDVVALKASISAKPDDAELKAELAVAVKHVRDLANALAVVVAMLKDLDISADVYQEQVLNATGQITTDVFEVGVITNLLLGWGQTLWDVIIKDGPNLVFKVLLFLIIVLGFRKLATFVQTIVERALEKSHLKFSELLRRMLVSIVRNIIILLGVLIALSQVGISLGPLLAGLGVVGFVVGFALQDSLSNFAAGMMILIYRPFDVGDLIEAGGVRGKVSNMSLVNTTILTLDNQTIVVPNNKIWGDVVKNVTAQTMRRIDLVFGISYSDDIEKTERVLQDIVDSHDKVMSDPEPVVRLHELADSSVNFVVRPWVNKDDYWDVYWDITRAVKMRFDAEGISIPFPQRDVHLYNQSV